MRREKSPGLKILWLWTLGTAAIVVTYVVRTRLRDMERFMNNEQQQQQQQGNAHSIMVDTLPESDEGIVEDVKRK